MSYNANKRGLFFVSPLSVRQAKVVLELREYLTRLSSVQILCGDAHSTSLLQGLVAKDAAFGWDSSQARIIRNILFLWLRIHLRLHGG